MRIRNRISLIFTISVALVQLGLGLFIYFFSAVFHRNEFYKRLEDRVDITEQLFLEADKLDPDVYQNIREKFLHTLEEETEQVYKIDSLPSGTLDILNQNYPPAFVSAIFSQGEGRFIEGHKQGVGKFYHNADGDFAVVVTAVDVFGESKLANLRKILAVGGLIGIFTTAIIGWQAMRQALLPIEATINKAQKIGATNLHLRLNVVNEHDEIGQLAVTFNDMLDRLENAFDAQRHFISNASHEIKNPLTAIMGEAEYSLERQRNPEVYRESLATIQKEAERLNQLVSNLLVLAKTGFDRRNLPQESVRVDDLLLDLIQKLEYQDPRQHFEVSISPGEAYMTLIGDAGLLEAAMKNLLENASKFSAYQPVKVTLSQNESQLIITVRDQGIGIPEEALPHIFDPLYRAPNARGVKGFGMGLSLTQKIINMHKGKLQFYSKEGKGTLAEVIFEF